jgi:hypothetical protein
VQTAATQIAASSQTTSEAAGLVPAVRQATVVTVDATTPPTCTVTFDGTTNVAGIQFLESYFPVVNDVVFCTVLSGTTWILGQLAPTSPLSLNVPTVNATGAITAGTVNATGAITASTFKDAAPGIWDVSYPYIVHCSGSYYVQFGTGSYTTSSAGAITINYVDWFPVATDVVVACIGATFPSAFATVVVDYSTISHAGFDVVCKNTSGGTINSVSVRINWIAYGH